MLYFWWVCRRNLKLFLAILWGFCGVTIDGIEGWQKSPTNLQYAFNCVISSLLDGTTFFIIHSGKHFSPPATEMPTKPVYKRNEVKSPTEIWAPVIIIPPLYSTDRIIRFPDMPVWNKRRHSRISQVAGCCIEPNTDQRCLHIFADETTCMCEGMNERIQKMNE